RTYYTPPFRMYLTLSVVFFLATQIGGASPGEGINFDIDSSPPGKASPSPVDKGGNASAPAAQKAPAPPTPAPPGAPPAPAPGTGNQVSSPGTSTTVPTKLDPERQKIVDEIVARVPEKDRARARSELEKEFAHLTPGEVAPIRRVVNDPCSG